MSAQDFQVLLQFGYLGVLIALYIEHIAPPLPAHVVLPLAGILVGQGELSFWGVLISAVTGGVLGSFTLYLMGYKLGQRPIIRYASWARISEPRMERIIAVTRGYGNNYVFALHAIPISPVRVLVSMMAGVNRLSWLRFLVAAWVGTFFWIAITLYVTAFASEKWGYLLDEAMQYPELVLGVTLLAGASFTAWFVYRMRQATAHPESS